MQQAFSDAHLVKPWEPSPLTGEIARLALMNEAYADMVAALGTSHFPDAHARFIAARNGREAST